MQLITTAPCCANGTSCELLITSDTISSSITPPLIAAHQHIQSDKSLFPVVHTIQAVACLEQVREDGVLEVDLVEDEACEAQHGNAASCHFQLWGSRGSDSKWAAQAHSHHISKMD
jgi:hypothetical protein